MNDFVRDALEELKEIQNEESIEYDELKRIVTDSKNRTTTILIGNSEIRIKNYFPKELKNQFVKVNKEINKQSTPNEEAYDLDNYITYTFLAGICLDSPYTSKKFWSAYDEQVGDASRIAQEIIERLNSTEDKIVKFRTQ